MLVCITLLCRPSKQSQIRVIPFFNCRPRPTPHMKEDENMQSGYLISYRPNGFACEKGH